MSSEFLYARFKEDVKHADNESPPLWNIHALEKGHLLTPADFGCSHQNIYEGFAEMAEKYPDHPCLGTRVENEYKWISYSESKAKIDNFAKGMLKEGLAP